MLFETEKVEQFKIVGESNDKIALIDADTIAYGACSVHEYSYYCIDKGDDVYSINLQDAIDHAVEHIEMIKTATGCKDVELHFSVGKHFRYDVDPNYKSNRSGIRRPQGLNEVKAGLLEVYEGVINTEWEADDMVVYLKKKYPDKYTICAVDKDVLKAVPGKHWNYYSRQDLNIDPKWVEINEIDALKHNYLQAIIGDNSDGIKGVPGIGAKGAVKWIPENPNCEADCWYGVKAAFESKGLTSIDAMITYQLVSMHQLVDDIHGNPRLELFNPLKFEVSEEV